MPEQVPFSDYIQIHRRLRATRRDYYLNNWRLLLPPFIAFAALGFALQSFFLVGLDTSFAFRLIGFLIFSTVAMLDAPRCWKKRRDIIYKEWKSDQSD